MFVFFLIHFTTSGLEKLSNGDIHDGSFFYKLLQTRMTNQFTADSDEIKRFENATRLYYQREKVQTYNQERLYDMIKFKQKKIPPFSILAFV